jgi:large subunit ribosomal protein L21
LYSPAANRPRAVLPIWEISVNPARNPEMYAVIESGGKQYRVAIGDKLKVEKLAAAEGDSVSLDRVLMVADGENITVGSPLVGSPVTATVVGHGKAAKIKVFKMKRRKNYRRTQGHRQAFTEIEITAIGGDSAPSKKADSKKSAKKATAKKATAKKATAKKTAPAGDKAGDDLTKINGIGPVIEKKLLGLGITTYSQIAEFDQKRIEEVDEQLNFKGRIEREEWVEQAKKLVG